MNKDFVQNKDLQKTSKTEQKYSHRKNRRQIKREFHLIDVDSLLSGDYDNED